MNMCSKGGGSAMAAPAPYNQPAAPPPTLPCGNSAMGTSGHDCSTKVKACGSAAMNKSSKAGPSTDVGPMGVGGTLSGKLVGDLKFMTCQSTKVKIEGAAAARLGDSTTHNGDNAMAGSWIAPSAIKVLVKG
jgi:uncharacterized Zn-binding protein involved in type VI secretion